MLLVALAIQLRAKRYNAWIYWLAIVMVAVFGTMVADVMHVVLGIPYVASTVALAVSLAVVFVAWFRVEGTLSIHSIVTPRRGAVLLGHGDGDVCPGHRGRRPRRRRLGLGYLASVVVFAVLFVVPALGYRFLGWPEVACFWAAYVMTRPLGASIADWLGKPKDSASAGWGTGDGVGEVLLFGLLIVGCVGYLTVADRRVQVAA